MRPFHSLALLLLLSWPALAQPTIAPTDALTPEEERKTFKLPPGFEAQLVVAEPDILKPMQVAFDLMGRMWVTCSQEYPFAAMGKPGRDKVVVLDDFGEDGKARKVTVFADDLNIPIGVLPLPDCKSVIVSSIDTTVNPPGCFIWKLTDTDGDGKADERVKLFGFFGIRDTHGMVNSFTLMPDGWVYACHGFSNDSKAKGKDGHEITLNSGNTIRFRPDGSRIEVFTRGQVNPFGMTYDTYFNLYNADCHSRPMTQLIRGAVYQSFGKPHDGLGYGPDMIGHDHDSTGLCGLQWYEADHFPKEYKGMMFLGNVVTNKINLDKIEFTGSTPKAVLQPNFLNSGDPWFRPTDIKLGPDGALYITDFYNKIIGHYEVDLKHPGRDRTKGRIWRIVWKGLDGKAPAPKPVGNLLKLNREKLELLLGHPNITVRMQATHAIINYRSEQAELNAKEIIEATPEAEDIRRAHRLWADEAESLFSYMQREMRKHEAASPEMPVTETHRLRLRTAIKEWERDREHRDKAQRLEQETSKFPSDQPQVDRALTDNMTAVPNVKNLSLLLNGLPKITNDVALRHSTRIALRETLRQPGAWTALKGEKLDEAAIRTVAEIALGIGNMQSAEFVTANLKSLGGSPQLAAFVEHASRYGDEAPALFEFVKTHAPKNTRLTLAMFQGYQRGLQQRGTRFDKGDLEMAHQLITEGLADTDPKTVQTCFDVASALKLKTSYEPVAAFAARKDRDVNLRAAAFGAMLNLDATSAVTQLGNLLNQADESVAAREKVAGVLGTVGTPEAYAQLLKGIAQAPARLQTGIATAMAGRPEGAEQLLTAVKAGKASARLLQERPVQAKLTDSKLPKVNERIAELTKGLPSADQKMLATLAQRKANFEKAKPDAKLGAALFKTSCAVCHQIAQEGAKFGPQLDGIGIRGIERLLEDVLDPSRNVDQAFRATTLELSNGRTLTGLLAREEGGILVLVDNLGKEIRVPAKDVDNKRQTNLSPMPANFLDTMKEEDFQNLLAFLLSQKAKPEK
ncbi:PVC-type heme-binding CxxCH protein [Zavarzinella formosa]|uniref:PVC-type heme-binding CxxCH protein n=1 Tax=Zavarzinella formosa TaxID=360055 RepID=UPI0002EC2449|nr:PVC-type heme-binding CxxCH protein [Zavarzinella formosa]